MFQLAGADIARVAQKEPVHPGACDYHYAGRLVEPNRRPNPIFAGTTAEGTPTIPFSLSEAPRGRYLPSSERHYGTLREKLGVYFLAAQGWVFWSAARLHRGAGTAPRSTKESRVG